METFWGLHLCCDSFYSDKICIFLKEKFFKNCNLLFGPDRAIVPSQVFVYSTKLILNNFPQMLFPF